MRSMFPKQARAMAAIAVVLGCTRASSTAANDAVTPNAPDPTTTLDSPRARALRDHLVNSLLAHGDLHPGRVAQAMHDVPRHAFVPDAPPDDAYADLPLPIGFDQAISQPAIVATMTEALELSGSERVLEIGTGSGYQAAVLGVLSCEVFSIEIVAELADRSSRRLAELGYTKVHVRSGDGYLGWPERAPFDRILVTAAPAAVPPILLDQLAEGGVLVAPVGPSPYQQELLRYRKSGGRFRVDDLGPVVFVPMVSMPSASSPMKQAAQSVAADDFVEQARTLQRVAACGNDEEVPARFDTRVVESHCATLRREYAQYRQRWLAEASPFFASIVPKDLPSVVVYPFGGGDLLAALATFPAATEFLTMSLEPAGDVRSIDTIQASQLVAALTPLRDLIARRLLVSFLSTENLGNSSRGALPGQLVLTLAALAIHGYEPVSLRYFDVEADGALRYGVSGTQNVELRFRAPRAATASTKVLRHFAVNLDDVHLAKNRGFVALLESKGRFCAMTKAASHLLWMDRFSTLRWLLVDQMEWMVSDVTGIPPRFARAAGFVQDAYGAYEGPDLYGPSEGRDVEDFVELFRGARRRSLPFSYGYRDEYGHGLVVVTRR
jgi:protein-L-isoaspartate(D-aspartate) O-methyltransferase